MQPLRVVIVGGGIGGLSCAIISRNQGLDVIVLEKAEKLTPVGAGIQIPPNASRIWSQYGLLERLREHSSISKATQLRRWKDGELLCSRSVGEELDARWPWLVIHRADYQRVLVDECERLGVDVRLKSEVQDIDFDNTKVTLKNGDIISGDVIVGADGLWSTLRARILGHDSPPQETGDLAYRGTFSLEALQALRSPAVDELCQQSLVTMWIGPESHSVFYPVRCGKEFNLVMTQPDDLPASVKTEEGDLDAMKAVFEGWDPLLRQILTAFPSVLRWKMMHHDELASWTKGNVALLGDACHPLLPYQAQGAAMAVEDGAIIAVLLGLYQHAEKNSLPHPSIPETLKLYESLQKKRTTTLHLGSISNQHLYHLDDGPEQEERDRILKEAKFQELPDGSSEPFIWIDLRYQKAILGRDAVGDARDRWEETMADIGKSSA
ncbi:FAD/NAD(P)-binding domain-containing protein [Periconia macrospinosa]|uniref:FAD/NAD(P)-binding domain-containing protein n=1 Tax=Periconia macrospinosa TaxID=97972 RepID=A0A2V1DGD1_9PLEO|nr:FAD/NAD(P)-binding domain-containing protein [Periconia macrospinosa]